MARYQVTTPRFFGKGKNAKLYGPGTKRSIITVDKQYPKGKVPSGLVLIKELTEAEKKAEEKKAVDVKKADDKKATEDKAEKDSVTFNDTVQTL